MGTNFYLHIEPDFIGKLKGEKVEILHIGKSSYGWCFALRIYPERGIHCLRDWWKLLRRRVNKIYDEYGDEVSLENMLICILERKGKIVIHNGSYRAGKREYNGEILLWRNHIDGTHCIGHGGGTFDYIVGDFS